MAIDHKIFRYELKNKKVENGSWNIAGQVNDNHLEQFFEWMDFKRRQYRLKGWLYFFVGRQIKNTKAATNNPNGNAQKGQNKKDWSKKHQELRRVLYLCECPGGNDKIKFKQDASHAIIQGYSGADFYSADGAAFYENGENKR